MSDERDEMGYLKRALTWTGLSGRLIGPLTIHNMQPTFRPHRKKRFRKIGFRARMATRGGRAVINARRCKGRKRLTVADC